MRWPLAVALFLISALSSAVPEILVVQLKTKNPGEFDVLVGQFIAEELDIEGRVSPILWSMTDPVFRAYVDEGSVPNFGDNPDLDSVRDFARKQKFAYVLVVEAVGHDERVYPQARLFRGSSSRPMWSMVKQDNRGQGELAVYEDGKINEEQTKLLREKYAELIATGTVSSWVVLNGGVPDWESTGKSLARTWNKLLNDGPFKKLEPRRRVSNPVPDPGLSFNDPEGTQSTEPTNAAVAIRRAQDFVDEDSIDQAILVLRDSIDVEPFQSETRLMLADLMMSRGFPKIAAAETERAASFSTESGMLWASAASAWVMAGDADKALTAANEARARGEDNSELLATIGDIWLLKGDPKKALTNFDLAIGSEGTPESFLGRSIARAMNGDTTGAIADLEAAQGEEGVGVPLYQRAILILDRETEKIIESLKAIPQSARLKDPEAKKRAELTVARTEAIVEFMVRIRVPERHKTSHEGRDLAHKLLAQSAYETLAFAESGNEDSAMEAAISLGEALRLQPQINEQFRLERKYG